MIRCIRLATIGMVLSAGFAAFGQDRGPTLPSPPGESNTATTPAQLIVNGKVVGEQVTPEPGEICLVCNEPIHDGDVVYLVQGQRVPIHLGQCDKGLRDRMSTYLGRLKPRGAFLGAPRQQAALSQLWFFAGLYLLLGLVFAALSAHRALHTGHNPVLWFGVGLVGTAFGYVWLLTRPLGAVEAPAGIPPGLGKVAATYPPQSCPHCGAANHPCATQCGECGAALEPARPSEVSRAGLRSS